MYMLCLLITRQCVKKFHILIVGTDPYMSVYKMSCDNVCQTEEWLCLLWMKNEIGDKYTEGLIFCQ